MSARHAEQTKINALDAGVDDYVTKPFGMGELQARIRAALRRATPGDEQPVITTTAFTVDLAAKRVTTAAGDEIRLTPTEWHLLEILARHAGKLVGHRHLLREVWGPGSKPKPATSASTWPTSGANSNPTPPGPDTYSPTPGWATGSPDRVCRSPAC